MLQETGRNFDRATAINAISIRVITVSRTNE